MKILLIGASNNIEKYGNKILKDLISKGHTVIPINPKEAYIEDIQAHKTLKTVPKDFDVVNFVVPPKVTLQILKKYKTLLLNKKVWIQPGAENDDIKDFLSENNFGDYITGSCIMINSLNKK